MTSPAPLRFYVTVAGDWTVSVDGPVVAAAMAGAAPGPLPHTWPPPGTEPLSLQPAAAGAPPNAGQPDAFLYQIWATGMSPDVPGLYAKIFSAESEDYTPQEVRDLGRFLFDRLLGVDAWDAICAAAAGAGTTIVELALRFDGGRYELHRLPWELMYGPNGFLAQGGPGLPAASVTRLVTRTGPALPAPAAGLAPAAGPAFQVPPRLLFAVGTRLTDSRVLAGAEIVGLLRQLNSRGFIVNTRVLLSASPLELGLSIQDFHPDVVHFTCHGEIEEVNGEMAGFLEFQAEDKKGTARHLRADDLLQRLRAGQRIPPVVVLSACYSGSTPLPPRAHGADRIGSLAAQLVAGGVPVVVGMGGKVADSACRMFTRFFGEALMRGDSLVAAVARGRRAAFLDGEPDKADWAFPILFLDAGLQPAYAPAAPPEGQPNPNDALALRIKAYGVPQYPVFCGRLDAMSRYLELFEAKEPARLVIFSRGPGLGRTRVLQECAAQALRDGHVPCLVLCSGPGWPTPPFAGAADLAAEILNAIVGVREKLNLRLPIDSSVLTQLIDAKKLQDLKLRLPNVTKRSEFLSIVGEARAAAGAVPGDDVWRAALQEDFQSLIDDARAVPRLAGPDSRVVLLLDDVHLYDKAIRPLFHTLIDDNGLGTANEPVPVVACYALGTPNDTYFTEAKEKIGSRELELKPFSNDEDEDLLAYEQVLLFPDEKDPHAVEWTAFLRAKSGKVIQGKVASYAINRRAAQAVKDLWVLMFRTQIQGMPVIMKDYQMYQTAAFACMAGYLQMGDDEDRLSRI